MYYRPSPAIEQRVARLQEHLNQENPFLNGTVGHFKELDQVAYRLGLLPRSDSFATRISWWPVISCLGTFSSGKSTFINQYIGVRLQETGTQAVDDKFSVICYNQDETARSLPAMALDADPRFPFYQISDEIETVTEGEGKRIDAYLQLKTCNSPALRGKILIDSPGFDADQQRNSTLRITDRIVNLSDLVLVFFDARHPEPGAMSDTLQHLVADTLHRSDSNKFLYILNQCDSAAYEDNLEEVVAAWQRAISQHGLTTGPFYSIYSKEAMFPNEAEGLRERYERKRDADLEEIHKRLRDLDIERPYRIIGLLESTADEVEHRVVPKLRETLRRWRRLVLRLDTTALGVLAAALLGLTIWAGYWSGLSFNPPWLASLQESPIWAALLGGLVILLLGAGHFWIRGFAARRVAKELDDFAGPGEITGAFMKSTRPWRSIFQSRPAGWTRGTHEHCPGSGPIPQ